MKINTFFYSIQQGFKNIARNSMFSLASMATMAACIFMFGIFYILVFNVNAMVQDAEESVAITVFFDEGLTEEQIKKIGKEVEKRTEVRDMKFVSAEEAWESFKEVYFEGNEELPTGQVSEKLGRGRHTTRCVELFDIGANTFVADTPGFSSFDTEQMDVILKENLQYAFPDFAPFIGSCQFHDCSHRKEPGCAVLQAVERGEIETTRHKSYLKLYEIASQFKSWERK